MKGSGHFVDERCFNFAAQYSFSYSIWRKQHNSQWAASFNTGNNQVYLNATKVLSRSSGPTVCVLLLIKTWCKGKLCIPYVVQINLQSQGGYASDIVDCLWLLLSLLVLSKLPVNRLWQILVSISVVKTLQIIYSPQVVLSKFFKINK